MIFNSLFNNGEFPQQWSKGLITPLHKKGSIHEVNNYRGISLADSIGKIYCCLLNRRLQKWSNENDLIDEAQAGYRKGYSTIDNVFTLQGLIQKYLSKKKGRIYSLFVDFSRAFDGINRIKLLSLMTNKGVNGHMLKTLKSMYKSVSSCVKASTNNITPYFDCDSGVRQGCMISPLLFSFYVNELVEVMESGKVRGIFTSQDAKDILMLLYADDLSILSDTIGHLQRKLNILYIFCSMNDLNVNCLKQRL